MKNIDGIDCKLPKFRNRFSKDGNVIAYFQDFLDMKATFVARTYSNYFF